MTLTRACCPIIQARTWTPVDLTRNVRKASKTPRQVMVHGKKYALYWYEGRPHMINDVCWHRGASLSAGGQITNDGCVTCKYHGLSTSASQSMTVVERDGIVWAQTGPGKLTDDEKSPPTSWEFQDPTVRRFEYSRNFSGCNAVLTVENTLDWSHLDSVHLFHLIEGVPEVDIIRTGHNGMATYSYASKVFGTLVIENEYWGPWNSCLRFVFGGKFGFTIHFSIVPNTAADSTLLVRVTRADNTWPLADAMYMLVNELPLWEDRYVVRHADPASWSSNTLTAADAFLEEYRKFMLEHHADLVSEYVQ